jgi:hypothetical protein
VPLKKFGEDQGPSVINTAKELETTNVPVLAVGSSPVNYFVKLIQYIFLKFLACFLREYSQET